MFSKTILLVTIASFIILPNLTKGAPVANSENVTEISIKNESAQLQSSLTIKKALKLFEDVSFEPDIPVEPEEPEEPEEPGSSGENPFPFIPVYVYPYTNYGDTGDDACGLKVNFLGLIIALIFLFGLEIAW